MLSYSINLTVEHLNDVPEDTVDKVFNLLSVLEDVATTCRRSGARVVLNTSYDYPNPTTSVEIKSTHNDRPAQTEPSMVQPVPTIRQVSDAKFKEVVRKHRLIISSQLKELYIRYTVHDKLDPATLATIWSLTRDGVYAKLRTLKQLGYLDHFGYGEWYISQALVDLFKEDSTDGVVEDSPNKITLTLPEDLKDLYGKPKWMSDDEFEILAFLNGGLPIEDDTPRVPSEILQTLCANNQSFDMDTCAPDLKTILHQTIYINSMPVTRSAAINMMKSKPANLQKRVKSKYDPSLSVLLPVRPDMVLEKSRKTKDSTHFDFKVLALPEVSSNDLLEYVSKF